MSQRARLFFSSLVHTRILISVMVAALDSFFIEIDFVGTWTDARRAVFQSAADR